MVAHLDRLSKAHFIKAGLLQNKPVVLLEELPIAQRVIYTTLGAGHPQQLHAHQSRYKFMVLYKALKDFSTRSAVNVIVMVYANLKDSIQVYCHA